jgi:hypothetical protein
MPSGLVAASPNFVISVIFVDVNGLVLGADLRLRRDRNLAMSKHMRIAYTARIGRVGTQAELARVCCATITIELAANILSTDRVIVAYNCLHGRPHCR